MADWAEVVRSRRMSRAFRPDPVDDALLHELIGDAARAPSAGKSQGWHAIVLRDADTARFWDATLPPERRDGFAFPDLLAAPVLIVIGADPQAYLERYRESDKQHTGLGIGVERWSTPYWTVDASMAAMCILLGAENAGLGALFFGIFEGEQRLRSALGIPDQVELIGAIALGYPLPDQRGGRSASRRTREPHEIIHESTW